MESCCGDEPDGVAVGVIDCADAVCRLKVDLTRYCDD